PTSNCGSELFEPVGAGPKS
ncbi:hypothetical protein RRG08_011045, partial [Elysia crispata]